jgi:hypothetical protein
MLSVKLAENLIIIIIIHPGPDMGYRPTRGVTGRVNRVRVSVSHFQRALRP